MSESPTRSAEGHHPLVPAGPAGTALDAHGYDPDLYQWVPVLRRPRKDGFTPQRQVAFIAALAETGIAEHAAREAGMSANSCFRLRRESPQFAAAWTAALAHAAPRLVDIAFDRSVNGVEEPVFDKHGQVIATRRRHNDRLLMFLLRAYMPERFRYAHQSNRQPDEPPPIAAEPIAQALLRLEPAPPPAPEMLMPPDELGDALASADALGGALPHWHRGQGDAEPLPAASLGDDFERALAAAKREAAGLPPTRGEGEGDEDAFLA